MMRIEWRTTLLACGASIAGLAGISGAMAQSVGNASVMWGTTGSSLGSGGTEGAHLHVLDGASAGQAAAAKSGLLLGPNSNISVTSVGVQNIITVTGDSNTVSGPQSGTNTGSISNSGSVAVKP